MPRQRNITKLLDAYHKYLLSKVGKVRILGEADERELKEVFVELTVVDRSAPQQRAEFLSMWDAALRRRFNPFAAPDEDALPEPSGRRVNETKRRVKPEELLRPRTKAIVTGAPGCGKTTLFKYLALLAAEKERRFAVWLELKAIDKSLFAEAEKAAERNGNLLLQELCLRHLKIQLLLSDAELDLLRRHWQERFMANEVAVLLDGFDELQDEAAERSLNKCTQEFASALHDNTLLISTRPYAQHKLGSEGLRELEVEPLNRRQIEAFLNCYYPNDTATKNLLKTLRERSSLRDLLHVPLLLGGVLRLHRENRFTDERLELYETIITDLANELDRSKSVIRRFKINDGRLRLGFLKVLAFELLLRAPSDEEAREVDRVVFSYDLLKEKAKEFLAREDASHSPRDLADDALATALLREVGADTFAFTHLTLQEFLAARAFTAFHKANESEGLKIFCRAYHNTTIVELEVLPMVLGSLANADQLYAEIERWPDSLPFANQRLRARGIGYGAKIKQQRLAELCEKFADTVMARNADEQPYRAMIIRSFANVRGTAEASLIASLTNLLTNPDPYSHTRMSAVEALAIIGSERAVDLLLQFFKDEDPIVRADAAIRVGEIRNERAIEPLIAALQSDNLSLRIHAVRALGHIGSEKAIEPLRIALKDGERMVRGDAIEALKDIGTEAAVEALTVALQDEDSFLRQKAVLAIGDIGSEKFIDVLISCLENDSDLHSYIAQALKQIDPAKSIPALKRILRSEDNRLRQIAVEVLKLIATNGAIELLLSAAWDENSSVRKAVAYSLHSVFFFSDMNSGEDGVSHIKSTNRKLAVKSLITALQDEDAEVRAVAASSLTNYHDQSAVPYLEAALQDEDKDVRASAARTLGFIVSKASVGHLLKALTDEVSEVRAAAAAALGQLGSAVPISPLLNALLDEDHNVRRSAITALGNIRSTSAVEHLLKALQDEDYEMRAYAAQALGQIGEESTFEPLLEMLKDEEALVREHVIKSLPLIVGERSLEALSAALNDDGGMVRIIATEEIAKIKSEKSVDLLATALCDLDINVTKRAAEALGKIGSERAIKILIEALQHENHSTRRDAAGALAQIETQPVVEAIFHIICNPRSDLQPYASWYLAKCDELKLRTAIVNSLANDKPYVRRRSAQIAGYYSDNPNILENLSQLAESDPDNFVRDAAKEAAEKFTCKLELSGNFIIEGAEQTLNDNESREGVINKGSAKDMKPIVGIITALPHEYAAVKVLLESQRPVFVSGRGAGRQYLYGEVPAPNHGRHQIVLALLPDTGNNNASTRAALLLEHFPSVHTIVMSGIAGGVPNPNNPAEHVRLGDIVVSDRQGVVQYDFGKEELREGRVEFTPRHPPRPPSASLVETARLLQAGELEGDRPWVQYINRGLERLSATRPSAETDVLVSSTDLNEVILHPLDPRRMNDLPRIFLGPIASSNTLQKNPIKRDQLRDRFGVKAVEMEGSGIADAAWTVEVPYLVIRGVCDYCDKNKGDEWQLYASVVAAAYTRALLESTPLNVVPSHVEKDEESQVIGNIQTRATMRDGHVPLKSRTKADSNAEVTSTHAGILGQYSSTVLQGQNKDPNISASMLRQIKNVSIRSEIAREAERVLRHEDYPRIMSLGGNLVDNPVWAEIPHDEQIRLKTSRRPDSDKCPLFMVLDLFLIRGNDSTGSPLLLTKYDGRRAGWNAFLFPFRKRMEKENPTTRYSSNIKQVAELLRVSDSSVKVSSLGRQYLVSVKPHPGYSELYAYVFEFCSVKLMDPPRWMANISCEPRKGDEERRFHWFHLSELQGKPREWQVNADVIRATTHFFAATKAKIPESVPDGFLP